MILNCKLCSFLYCLYTIKIKITITLSKISLHPKKGLLSYKMSFPDQPVRKSLRTHHCIETPGYSDPYETRSWDDGCCVYKTGLASCWTLESHIDLLHIKLKTVGRPMGKKNIFMIM